MAFRSQLESDFVINSSRKQGSKFLGVITPEKAESLLQDLANLNMGDYSLAHRIIERYPDVFPSTMGRETNKYVILFTTQDYLRKAWDGPDLRHREWWLRKLRDLHERVARDSVSHENYLERPQPSIFEEFLLGGKDPVKQPVPEITVLEAAVLYLQRIGDRAKHCQGPNCSAPYFIAPKRSQKFCKPECAEPAQRESKRQWWRENRAKDRD